MAVGKEPTRQRWTRQRVLELAPDRASATAAQRLAPSAAWSATGIADALVWGQFQGSGVTPYEVDVDLAASTTRCTCPSRKTPCKHAIGLLLRWAEGHLQPGSAPRPSSPANPSDRAPRAVGPADVEAADRRRARRLVLMDDGLEELERWLVDLVRDGLAAVRHRPYGYFDAAAARLVDAQLPGLAERVRDLPGEIARRGREDVGGNGWADHLLHEVGRLHLAARAWRRRDALDTAQLGDVRTALGWAWPAHEILAGPGITDDWVVAGVFRSEVGRLAEQRTWLLGRQTGETAVILDFAGTGMALETPQAVGAVIHTEIALYPGASPRRCRVAGDVTPAGRADDLPQAGTLGEGLARAAVMAADNPWRTVFPLAVAAARLVRHDDGLALVDADGMALPAVEVDSWQALALTGGRPVAIFGELAGSTARVLSLLVDGEGLVPL